MDKERLLDNFIRACKRDVVVEKGQDGYLISYPKPRKDESKEEVKEKWKRLIELLIENNMM